MPRQHWMIYVCFCLIATSGCDLGPTPNETDEWPGRVAQASGYSADVDCSQQDDGQPCDDGNACTAGDTCASGACQAGQERHCAPHSGQCGVAQCNPESGQCEVLPASEGEACDDGSACTISDVCRAGTCGGSTKDCSEYDSDCTQGVCHIVTGQCGALAINEAGGCEDGDLCTLSDSCYHGLCVPGGTKDCSGSGDACSSASCNSATGACQAIPAAEGSACEDGDLCTVGEVCQGGVCGPGAPKDCSSLESACAQATCDPQDGSCGAQAINEGSACEDGNVCTAGGTCSSGSCAGAPIAPPHDECTSGQALSSGCTLCVSTVCFHDSYCCDQQWDSLCVQEAEMRCGFDCG